MKCNPCFVCGPDEYCSFTEGDSTTFIALSGGDAFYEAPQTKRE